MYPEIKKKYPELNKMYPNRNKAIIFIRPYFIAPGPCPSIFC